MIWSACLSKCVEVLFLLLQVPRALLDQVVHSGSGRRDGWWRQHGDGWWHIWDLLPRGFAHHYNRAEMYHYKGYLLHGKG